MADQPPRRSQRENRPENLRESPLHESPQSAKSARKPRNPDYGYRPSQEGVAKPGSTVYASPRRNIQWKEEVKPEARQAVIDDSVHGLSCSICGCDNNGGSIYNLAHLLDRSLAGDEALIAHLEQCWGLEPGTFYLHSRHNMLILCVKCHIGLDKHLFGLLPPSEVIEVVDDFTQKTPEERSETPISVLFKHDPDNPITYRVVDIGWTGNDPFVVYLPGMNNRSRIEGIYPPFHDPLLSNIELHVNPVYMLWNLGVKLQELDLDIMTLDVPTWQRTDLLSVRRIFQSWDLPEPDGDDQKPSGAATSDAAGAAATAPDAAVSDAAALQSAPSPEDASQPRRSKRLRKPSNAQEPTVNDPPPPKRAKPAKSSATASRR